jgi:hypothetical protein
LSFPQKVHYARNYARREVLAFQEPPQCPPETRLHIARKTLLVRQPPIFIITPSALLPFANSALLSYEGHGIAVPEPSLITCLCPCSSKIPDRFTVRASKDKRLAGLAEDTEFQQFVNTSCHCHFSSVSVLCSTGFPANPEGARPPQVWPSERSLTAEQSAACQSSSVVRW